MSQFTPALHPMIPFLTGWLMASTDKMRVEGVAKIVGLEQDGHDGFRVRLASGLVLQVRVSEVQGETQ